MECSLLSITDNNWSINAVQYCNLRLRRVVAVCTDSANLCVYELYVYPIIPLLAWRNHEVEMEEAAESWTEQGQNPSENQGNYYMDQQLQEQQFYQQQYEQGGTSNMMQGNEMAENNFRNEDELLDEDEDILDEMEDDNNDVNNYNNAAEGANQNSIQDQSTVLLMKFCPHDSSMLYPKDCKRTKTLRYACGLRNCNYSEECNTSMVYQNILKQEVKNVLHKVSSAVSDDPALPRTLNESCESCGYNEAVFFQSDTSDVRSDTLALIFVCCSCGHKWVK